MDESSILVDTTISSINESIIIDESFNASDSGVIENSVIEPTLNDTNANASANSENDSDHDENTDTDDNISNKSSVASESGDRSESLVTSDIHASGDENDSGTSSKSSDGHKDSSKSLVTSDIHISGNESDPSSEVLNISDDDSEDVKPNPFNVKKPSKIYTIESSDESSIVEMGQSSAQFRMEPKQELATNYGSNVKPEPRTTAKFETGTQPKLSAKLNALQLVDDVKPIFTGKTGMETFNNQQSMALSCMKNLCKSLEVKPSENELADNPKELKIELMPHQRSALTWMLWRENQRPKGGILADDMGLGKTMSMISLIVTKLHMDEKENGEESSDSSDDESQVEDSKPSWTAKGSASKSYYYGGTLIVCPASIMDQWKAEVKNRVKSNTLTVVLHHGSNRESVPRRLGKNDMVITTYGIVSSEYDNKGALFSIKWERVILDEAHIIRNHTSKQSIACCKLKASARWTLTGTPIQNKEADLYPLLKFLRCRPFDDYSSFKMWISKSSTKAHERLTQVLQALLLRRTKEDLKEIGQIESLPEKTKEIVPVKLTVEEMNVYQKVMIYSQTLFARYLHQRETRNNFSIPSNSDQKNEWLQLHQKISKVHGAGEAVSGHHILILILRLRQICIHPSLINAMLGDGEFEDGGDSDTENVPEVDLLEQLSKLQIGSHEEDNESVSKASSKVLLRSNPVFDEKRISSKFQKIIEYISEKLIGTGDKGIVVSQFASVLNMFGDHLRNIGIKFVMLTGQTKIDTRNDIVTNFNNSNSSVQVMLLSLTAGGVGLNLVGANHLFFVDPHWNPQLENQAQDRIYRLGQKKPVTIYKFLCDDTIERQIQHLQENKLEIANQVLTGAKRTTTKLTIDDMKMLFDL